MTYTRYAIFFLCVWLGTLNAAQAENQTPIPLAPQKVFNAQSFTLDNGLQLVVVENHRAPVITHMI